MNRRVTVILPVYNGANYLESAMRSVLAQDFEDFELHVLDDGSTDASPAIAQGFGDRRVRYSRNPGRFGLFKTLNRGFEEASTPLVRIWAHDDLMTPDSLGKFVSFANRHPTAGMVYCDFLAIDANGARTGSEKDHVNQRIRTPELADPSTSALLFWLYGCLPGNISTVMLRRETWASVGGFLTGYQQCPDYDMWCRVSEQHPVGFISEPLVHLREHPLQLGRLGQKLATTVEEEFPVFERLMTRLEGILKPEELRSSWVVRRGCIHVHWTIRAFLRGDLASARRGVQALRRYPWYVSQALFWLVSANARFFVPSRDALFDRAILRIRAHSVATTG